MYLYLNSSAWTEHAFERTDRESLSAFSERLVLAAFKDFCDRNSLVIPESVLNNLEIKRDTKGKPYFSDLTEASAAGVLRPHFSVSHSHGWWGCLMASEPVGFDLEVCREGIRYEQIAQRFFSEAERKLVFSAGFEGFFEIWVRKEAYVKFLGSGLGEGLGTFSVVSDGRFGSGVISIDNGVPREQPCCVRSCEIGDGVKAAYCSGSGDPIKDIIILERPLGTEKEKKTFRMSK